MKPLSSHAMQTRRRRRKRHCGAQTVRVCEHCDTVTARVPLRVNQVARCPCCGSELERVRRLNGNVQAMLGLTLTTFVAFIVANAFPIVTLRMQGEVGGSTLWGTLLATWDAGYWEIALLTAGMVLVAPLTQLIAMSYVLIPLQRNRRPAYFDAALRLLRVIRQWNLVEVFMLGTLISVVKVWDYADVRPRAGIFALGLLAFLIARMSAVDLQQLWERGDAARPL